MSYSQKYCLVSFLRSVEVGVTFNMADWPLHMTWVGTFAIDRTETNIESKLHGLLTRQSPVTASATTQATLGTTQVVLLDKSRKMKDLHNHICDLLIKNHGVFNNPEFTGDGFLPHCTVQKSHRINIGDKFDLATISLIDMFPDNDWQQRKVLSTFKLQGLNGDIK